MVALKSILRAKGFSLHPAGFPLWPARGRLGAASPSRMVRDALRPAESPWFRGHLELGLSQKVQR